MKLVADENFPVKSFLLLQSAGYDVIHISIDRPSVADEEVIDIAIKEERIIITFDNDYGNLVFRKGMKPLESFICGLRSFPLIFQLNTC